MQFDLIELLQYLGFDGASAIWGAIIIFILWVLFSDNKASNYILGTVFKRVNSLSEEFHHTKETAAIELNAGIDEVLRDLREQTNATNAIVFRYKNGRFDSLGSSILKFYATNEKTKPGYLQIGETLQDVSRSIYGDFCDTLLKEDQIFLKDKKSVLEQNSEFASVMHNFGNAEKLYARALKTSDQRIVGFICLVYTEDYQIADKVITAKLADASGRISDKIDRYFKVLDKKKLK